MMDLLEKVKARVQTLTAALSLDDPTGAQRPPRVFIGALPPKRGDAAQGEDYPFVVVRPMSGAGDRRTQELRLDLILGTWTASDIVAGLGNLDILLDAVAGIQEDRTFTPYHLTEPLTWRLGDEQGMQPHPCYYATVTITFKFSPRK